MYVIFPDITFLGYIVARDGVRVNLEKVVAISTWVVPNNVHEVRNFNGLASFCRRFI